MITTNSLGKRIAKTDEQIAAFWRWFGASAAREPMLSSKERWSDKKPLVLYHGTKHTFTSFRPTGTGTVSHAFGSYTTERHGMFFAESAEFAATFSEQGGDAHGGRVIPVYLRVENPLDLTTGISEEDEEALRREGVSIRWLNNLHEYWEAFDGDNGARFVAALKNIGFDGVMLTEENTSSGERENVWVVFSPTQIKSATGNRGTFDPSDPVITNPPLGNTGREFLVRRLERELQRELARVRDDAVTLQEAKDFARKAYMVVLYDMQQTKSHIFSKVEREALYTAGLRSLIDHAKAMR